MLPPYGCFRYIKPSNIIMLHDHFPKKAYYSKLQKTYYAQYEPQQFLLAPIPLDDERFAAPEVLSGRPYDVQKAMDYSVGASLYHMLTVTMGMKHVVTKVSYRLCMHHQRFSEFFRRDFTGNFLRRRWLNTVPQHTVFNKRPNTYLHVHAMKCKTSSQKSRFLVNFGKARNRQFFAFSG